MSKTETPKISVTKRDAINGDITEQIKFVSDVRERITNLKMEEKVDDGGRKTYYAEWIWWLITHYKLPKPSDIITSDEGHLSFDNIAEDQNFLYAGYLESKFGYLENQLDHNESLDIYGTPVDASDPIHDQRLREMTSFPKRLLQQVGVELGNILKEHSSRPIEISYHLDKLAP